MKMEKLGHSEKTTVGKRGKRKSLPPAGRLLEHNGRTSSPEHPDRQRGNDKIDPARTHLNYDLAEPLREELYAGKSAREIYAERYAADKERYEREHGQAMRKDAVTLIEWCITAPKDLPPEYHEQFFQESYEWFLERYGKDRVIAANVHMDETTPHMHLDFMPFVGGKLCAKNLETPSKLKKVHPDLQKHLTEKLGVPVNLLNGETAGGDKSKADLEAQSIRAKSAKQKIKAMQEISELQDTEIQVLSDIANLNRKYDDISAKIEDKLNQIDRLDEEITLRQERLDELDAEIDDKTARQAQHMELYERMTRQSAQYQEFMRGLSRKEKGRGRE